MRHFNKKALSLVLAIVLVLSVFTVLPMSASAATQLRTSQLVDGQNLTLVQDTEIIIDCDKTLGSIYSKTQSATADGYGSVNYPKLTIKQSPNTDQAYTLTVNNSSGTAIDVPFLTIEGNVVANGKDYGILACRSGVTGAHSGGPQVIGSFSLLGENAYTVKATGNDAAIAIASSWSKNQDGVSVVSPNPYSVSTITIVGREYPNYPGNAYTFLDTGSHVAKCVEITKNITVASPDPIPYVDEIYLPNDDIFSNSSANQLGLTTISGKVFLSSLPDNASVFLTDDTVLVIDCSKQLKNIYAPTYRTNAGSGGPWCLHRNAFKLNIVQASDAPDAQLRVVNDTGSSSLFSCAIDAPWLEINGNVYAHVLYKGHAIFSSRTFSEYYSSGPSDHSHLRLLGGTIIGEGFTAAYGQMGYPFYYTDKSQDILGSGMTLLEPANGSFGTSYVTNNGVAVTYAKVGATPAPTEPPTQPKPTEPKPTEPKPTEKPANPKQLVKGTVYTSKLPSNCTDLVLTGDTKLIVDSNRTLNSISGDYVLTIIEPTTIKKQPIPRVRKLTVSASSGSAIRTKTLAVAAPVVASTKSKVTSVPAVATTATILKTSTKSPLTPLSNILIDSSYSIAPMKVGTQNGKSIIVDANNKPAKTVEFKKVK